MGDDYIDAKLDGGYTPGAGGWLEEGNAGGFHDRIQQGRYQRDIQGWYGNSYRVTVARAKSRANFLVFLSYFMVK